ncbi:Disease resistance protein [Thalictrum thalictroides]|uniref:Disease resistance protein n=1 Tax=Thalictrum thalictroides TaxID=46969 RepID=A0A7J6WBJ1_THATH|nr:Disease resistance protein [Thalictrum thalictroides]
MQTLKLKGCLKLLRLPKGLSNLINLRHLDVDVSCLLVSMPPRFGNLVELQTLPAFVVGKENGCQVTELNKMMKLWGTFRLLRLENVSSSKEAEEAALDQKKNLNKLEFHWTELQDGLEFYGRDNVARVQDFEYNIGKRSDHDTFVAFPTLEYLTLKGMSSLEEWSGLKKLDFTNLQKLNVSGCPKLAILPKLSHLMCLKILDISLCPSLKSLPDKGLPNSIQSLVIIDCPVLKDWCNKDGGHYWRNTLNIPNVWIDYQQISQEGENRNDEVATTSSTL